MLEDFQLVLLLEHILDLELLVVFLLKYNKKEVIFNHFFFYA